MHGDAPATVLRAGQWLPTQANCRLDAPHHCPVLMRAMPHAAATVALRIDAARRRSVAVATIIATTGTIRAGVRTRVQD
ncbi:hypothetical protein [Luteimonas saliphila]|uniref:hypothetical protein n=1 Tax=Luteimonas saliphila TaxID=2804919 RepID=UPI00192E0CDD|nr:hypothetical protein [Luteimonas saliphila]